MAAHTLRFDERSRGSLVGSWTFPVWGNFRCHIQVGEGYGETMIDYNHPQAVIGVSISLIDW